MTLNKEEEAKLKQLLDAWEDIHRTMKFFKAVGKILAWIIALGAGFATMWSAFKGH